ncbi:hypothetical protein EDD16DRAFT_1713942 [Pisolithus croceorrhizus]|nr:hypothetical protein EDD16DRAFT_1713942 [Pisolithus croceorrhizus]
MAFLMTFPPHKLNETFLMGGMHAEAAHMPFGMRAVHPVTEERLGDITPPGKLSSMVKGLKMHMIHHWLLDVTQDIQLGGQYATTLVGPTPSRLIPTNVPSIEAPEDFVVPAYTQHSDAALDAANWRV